ncbi:MAG: hypothetical protein GF383_05685 [Candidatus Lokiarchaeota archaeon]|nr:hypothetical protein [Candidatus Lokiarchaeota archaeon]MBD3339422.1 hypothetical protein [Candidatus Lokiarchaeota archaeon]
MVEDSNILRKIRNFIKGQKEINKRIRVYDSKDDKPRYFKKLGIKVRLNENKQIILQEETALELGGIEKNSSSFVIPIKNKNQLDLIQNGKITLIGPEIEEIPQHSIHFGMIILIGSENMSDTSFEELNRFSFLSNSIEGFSIRTIPQRFWCRISKDLMHKRFSFEFLGNAFLYLYDKAFAEICDSMEVLFLSNDLETLEALNMITQEVRATLIDRWKKKVDDWKKRIDCDYEWECEVCPYQETCEDLKKVMEIRDKMD